MRKMKEDFRERPRASLNAPYAWPVGVVLNLFFTCLSLPFPKHTVSICSLIMFIKRPNAPFRGWVVNSCSMPVKHSLSQPLDFTHVASSLSFPFQVWVCFTFIVSNFQFQVLSSVDLFANLSRCPYPSSSSPPLSSEPKNSKLVLLIKMKKGWLVRDSWSRWSRRIEGGGGGLGFFIFRCFRFMWGGAGRCEDPVLKKS